MKAVKRLEVDQELAFDKEYVTESGWIPIGKQIASDFPTSDFRFLDIGGGNGRFTDSILDRYPMATGVIVDISEALLQRNTPHQRKCCIHSSIENMDQALAGEKFDIIFFNWVLHHLVVQGSYQQTRQNICAGIEAAVRLLSDRGRLSIYENLFNGLVIDQWPSRMIYSLTSSRLLRKVARRCGANSAGVGVCFLSEKDWLNTFEYCQLKPLAMEIRSDIHVPWTWKYLLHVGSKTHGFFWLAPV